MKKRIKELAVQLSNVSKKYELHHEKPTLVEKFVKGRNEIFWALKNINLNIKKGEKIGIVGPNGSGKTTLLKIITGIATPTTGTVSVSGRIASLIDLDAGFHPDLTGVQNIYINGMLLGMNKREIEQRLPSIIEFADIKQFIDAPIFTYSQGMMFRLAFSVGVHSDPDILILDENVSVGDEDFQKKSQRKIHELFEMQKTIIVVSHWADFIRKNCNRLVRLQSGEIVRDGKIKGEST